MKTSIAITLIICGTLLVLSPALVELVQYQQVTSTLRARPDFKEVTAGDPMHPMFTIACVSLGATMIGFATFISTQKPGHSTESKQRPNSVLEAATA